VTPNDRLDRIEHLVSIRNVHADDEELFKLILEELRMLRDYTMQHSRIVDGLRREIS
jgi:hypothetical protein